MNWVACTILASYVLLVRLCPRRFRQEFGAEMQAVFAEAVAAVAECGWAALIALFWRELRDWPVLLSSEYWLAWRRRRRRTRQRIRARAAVSLADFTHRRWIVEGTRRQEGWSLADQRQAVVTSLPPFLFGLGMAVVLLLIGTRPHDVSQARLMLGVAPAALVAAIILGGGLIAAVHRLPDWGYTWVGAALMECWLVAQVVTEELAEEGVVVPPLAAAFIGGLLLVAVLIALGVAARRGWAQAGLVSIGMASIMGLSVCFSAASGPMNRHDVAVLAAPLGLVCALLTYAYVRYDRPVRLGVIVGVGCLNALSVWMVSRVWQDWLLAHNKPSFAVPMLAFLTGALVVGPLLAWLGEIARRLPRRA